MTLEGYERAPEMTGSPFFLPLNLESLPFQVSVEFLWLYLDVNLDYSPFRVHRDLNYISGRKKHM